ncbi:MULTISPECIES: phage minor capsid protein [unclassified Cryobacterium]|uniref:phage minor capsid protein n=1 Tax=unclassified Cryobacterium TaxID=2649013 RepID=UPI00106CA5A1|nr:MULTISPECIES: phage minor capsid protein [unclassified Cryobacterium]TFC59415.1 hypothetical protein E3O68_00505 [Cryobacterium sp. TMB3-1-2]TFC67211.1 hypothetical protein E3T21_17200 [Cryobacterium sp. TMB3-15]TFC73276.1 hypothetical protein E3T22_16855 [Cryobacterium sp. TMB3-10]TFD46164.1 hypothetical protein E3T58_01490 [Cryobacterium sp. TMB3-12]
MALMVPNPDIPAEDLIDDLGRTLAERYQTAEDVLIREVAVRAYRDIELQAKLNRAIASGSDRVDGFRYAIERNRQLAELSGHRAQSLRDLQALARTTADQLRAENLAESVINAASTQGEAEAAARLSMARRLPARTTLNGSAPQATAQTALSLQSSLEVLNQRITRLPVDAFQRIVAMNSSNVLLGVQTKLQAQHANVQQFLSEGISGFTDKGGRNWRIGTYAEMAGRTTVARAFNDAGVWRMQQSGINLVTVQGSLSSCAKCAPWVGVILSTDGSTGTVILPHATKDAEATVTIAGTTEGARNAGLMHPNCSHKFTAYLPGLSIPQAGFEYDPKAEWARTRQREIEVDIRAAKRKQATAGDPVTAQRAKAKVRAKQAQLREHLDLTGRKRNSAREQLAFADGR